MKRTYSILLIVGTLFLNACNTTNQKANEIDFPPLEALFFEENPPGLIPEILAPGFVATGEDFVGNAKFSSDMKEIYVDKHDGNYKNSKTIVIRYENNKWHNDSIITNIKRPDNFSKDGTIIYKQNKYRKRTESGWSELKNMGAPFDDKFIMGISITGKKTIFFSHFDRPDRDGAISYSRFIDGKYQPSQKLGKEINNGKPLAHPYVAPDESYILWDAVREGGYGDSDLYISFKQKDGSWGVVMNLGPYINTEQSDSSPSVTPDGKYLTFFRGGHTINEDGSFYVFGNPYWVSVQVIENLRPDPDLQNSAATTYPIAYGADGICLTNIEGTSKIKLTEGYHGYPAWSPDGKRIAFYGKDDNKKTWSIHTINSDGTNMQRLTHLKK